MEMMENNTTKKHLEVTMSKIYTEQQVKQMIEKSRETGLTAEYLILTSESIQLPTNEEISNNSSFKNATDYTKEEYYNFINFMNGAKWMRDKIKGGQDE